VTLTAVDFYKKTTLRPQKTSASASRAGFPAIFVSRNSVPPADTAPASPTVEFRHVEKRYGSGPVILEDFNLTAAPGDFIALIGPSGCGKSTLLKLIAGLSPVTTGQLILPTSAPSPLAHHPSPTATATASASASAPSPTTSSDALAYVFQEPTLLPWLTAAENVALPLDLRATPPARRAELIATALALVDLTEHAGYYPRQLSGGQKMRVSIARALVLSPQLLLLDEPFGALDEMTRDRLNEELLAIRERQRWTAFFVTHSVAEAVFLANRIVVMSANPGRLHREIRVDLPYPRTPATRRDPAYHRLVDEVSQLLRSVEDTPSSHSSLALHRSPLAPRPSA
jgi:NitT/TauT family transport system ATP-binding protein